MSEIAYKNSNLNIIKDDIYYLIKNGEISFFYKELLLFRHNKNNPVVSVIMAKGDAEKEIPLTNYYINKLNINEYDIEFYNQIYKVKAHLKKENNLLQISIQNSGNYYCLKLSFKNSTGKIKGFGLNKEEISQGKELCSDFFEENKRNTYCDDRLLSFYKENKYFLCVEGNYEWKIRTGNLIDIYFKKPRHLDMKVYFCTTIEQIKASLPSLDSEIFKRGGKIIKTTIEDLKVIIGKEKISTVILCDNSISFINLQKIREKLKKLDIKVLRQIQMKISERDDYFKEFCENDFVKSQNNKLLVEKGEENLFYFDLSNAETCRKVKNYIRRILGTNIDGLVSIEKENKLYNREEYKSILQGASLMWQSILYEVSLEYIFPKTILFDTLSSTTYLYGYYIIDSQKLYFGKAKKYLENLKNSGIFNTAVSIKASSSIINKGILKKLKGNYNIIYT